MGSTAEAGEVGGDLGGGGFEGAGAKRGEGFGGDDDVGGAGELGGKVEWGGEDGGRLGEGDDAEVGDAGIAGADAVDDPAVEADLADRGARSGEERGGEEGDEQARGGRKSGEKRRGHEAEGGRGTVGGGGGRGEPIRRERDGAGLARGEKTGTVAGAMSAAEIIELIEKLPVAEQEQVRVYLEKKTATAEGAREIRYVSDETFGEIAPKIFEQHHDLLRRLSQ